MELHIHPPLSFSEPGERPNNQDFIFPEPGMATARDRIFLVCDGIGGADRGEEASRIVGQQVADYFLRNRPLIVNKVAMREAMQEAYDCLKKYIEAHPLVSRMGTTLALLQLHEQGASVVNLGDSRVYHVGRGGIKFCTTDHKQVCEMVEAGIITSEQAKTHPWRNRLSRAILASSAALQDESRDDRPDLTHLTNVEVGDYFFLCTDGVLEQLDETRLLAILRTDATEEEKLQQLIAVCQHRTKDNFSGYLVCVNAV
ncbi:MAG: protein phosphatase 2C domain-containing protein [Cytophagaceae bacterium]|nr:protein phosphatase 2C domain-containing protein [Cytophagaceae bacterium]